MADGHCSLLKEDMSGMCVKTQNFLNSDIEEDKKTKQQNFNFI
jgi:hypothetical protein